MEWKRQTFESLLIRGGRVVDPFRGVDAVADLAVVGGQITADAPRDAHVLDAAGCIVCPGLMDIHVHLREPGQTHKETIATGTLAAAAGGFTFVACMPNTQPPIDDASTVHAILEQAHVVDHCDVGPIAAMTTGRLGNEITDFAQLLQAGAVAFSDDGTGVEDDGVMRMAFESARRAGAVLIQHCEYRAISAGGVMHLGETSRRLGLPGLDPRSEEAMIERDLALCEETGGRYHVAHISTARAVDLVRHARARGVAVTAEVCPHHLLLTDKDCANGDPNTKMHPPLRSDEDVAACRAGLLDGTIDCVATDHAPHTADEKSVGFLKAPPGIVGLETAVPLTARAMMQGGKADWPDLVRWFTCGPAKVLGLSRRGLEVGSVANISLLDPGHPWRIDSAAFESKSCNSPFGGWEVIGRATGTVRGRTAILADLHRINGAKTVR